VFMMPMASTELYGSYLNENLKDRIEVNQWPSHVVILGWPAYFRIDGGMPTQVQSGLTAY
jgi:hypothetical protein